MEQAHTDRRIYIHYQQSCSSCPSSANPLHTFHTLQMQTSSSRSSSSSVQYLIYTYYVYLFLHFFLTRVFFFFLANVLSSKQASPTHTTTLSSFHIHFHESRVRHKALIHASRRMAHADGWQSPWHTQHNIIYYTHLILTNSHNTSGFFCVCVCRWRIMSTTHLLRLLAANTETHKHEERISQALLCLAARCETVRSVWTCFWV